MDIVDALLGAHEVLWDQCRRLVQTVSVTGDVVSVHVHAWRLGAAVRDHATREDDLLFVPLEQILGPDDPALVYVRLVHELIELGLASLDRTQDLESARARFLEIVAMIQEHFRKEEQALFPLARAFLAPEARERSGAAWKARRGAR